MYYTRSVALSLQLFPTYPEPPTPSHSGVAFGEFAEVTPRPIHNTRYLTGYVGRYVGKCRRLFPKEAISIAGRGSGKADYCFPTPTTPLGRFLRLKLTAYCHWQVRPRS